jgi:hypothetical protein
VPLAEDGFCFLGLLGGHSGYHRISGFRFYQATLNRRGSSAAVKRGRWFKSSRWLHFHICSLKSRNIRYNVGHQRLKPQQICNKSATGLQHFGSGILQA